MSHVFISYNRNDLDYAVRLADSLRQGGFDVWIDDRSIDYGDRWWRTIERAIYDCAAFVVIMTPDAEESEWVHRETLLALREKKSIFPLLLKGREFGLLVDRQYSDVRGGNMPPADFYLKLERATPPKAERGASVAPTQINIFGDVSGAAVNIGSGNINAQDIAGQDVVQKAGVAPQRASLPIARLAIEGLVFLAIVAVLLLVAGGIGSGSLVTSVPTTQVAVVPSDTSVPTLPPTDMPTATDTPTDAPTVTNTSRPTVTHTPTNTPSNTPTNTSMPITPTLTDTPTATSTLVPTVTNTPEPTVTNTPSSTSTPTFTPLVEALQRARNFSGGNDDWQPYFETFNGVEMALVPAGCFMMGSEDGDSDERPVHQQCFDAPFWIGRYEVTNGQYQQCVDAGACEASNYTDDSGFNDPQQPVVGVTWFQAQDYAEWAGYQLPTEAQWEYAARGPDSLTYPWGEDAPNCDRVNFHDGSDYCVGSTSVVGSYSPAGDSWVGVADMSGNVWEWTSTIYTDYPYDGGDGREDPGDSDSRRVVRGGSWNYDLQYARAAFRYWFNPNLRYLDRGFRVVASSPTPDL